VLKVPARAPNAVRYAVALDALVAEMRRNGSGQKRYELEHGRVVDHQAGHNVYAFAFNEDATIFEDAEVEIEIEGQRAKGQIVSITQDTLLVAIAGEFGGNISRCMLLIDDTALLVALKERLEQAQKGEIHVDLELANSVVDRDQHPKDVQAIGPSEAQLNSAQQRAVRHLPGKKIAFLWGPPGPGKTYTLSVVVQSAFAAEKRVLVCSNTNQAVDQVLVKLCKRLETEHPAVLEQGRILRLGQVVNKELKDAYAKHVTSDGILNRAN
jgi:hypothetical protein